MTPMVELRPRDPGRDPFYKEAKVSCVLNIHVMELSCLLVCETSRLGVVLRTRIGSDST